MANTLAYYDTATITAVKSFIVQAPGGLSSILYLNVVHFSTSVLIRYLWQLETIVFLHWCLIHGVLFWRQRILTNMLPFSAGHKWGLYNKTLHGHN